MQAAIAPTIALTIGFAALAVAAPAPPPPAPPPAADRRQLPVPDAVDAAMLREGFRLVQAGKPAEGIVRFDRVIAAYQARYGATDRRIYCGRTVAELTLYMSLARKSGRAAMGLDSTWSDALFGKGFALTDLGRPEEAAKALALALELAPMNSVYLAESAELRMKARDWQAAFALFQRSADGATYLEEEAQRTAFARATRGMGLAKYQMGDGVEAKRLLDRANEIDPPAGKK